MNKYRLEIVAFTLFSITSVYFIFTDYSLWWDELYSITAANMSYIDLWSKTILIDVHPPLHQFILKLWLSIFPNNAISARMLSFTFTFLSITVLLINKEIIEKTSKGYILLFICAWPVIYYSNEVRSYSLVLLLSTLLFVDYLKHGIRLSKGNYVTLLLLSLTHYFGLIFSGLYLISLLAKKTKNKKEFLAVIMAGISMLIFPFVHFIFGNLADKSGGNFWITSTPLDSITKALGLLFPFTTISHKLGISLVIVNVLLFACGIILIMLYKRYKINANILTFTSIYITLVALIDLNSPMSTPRNFIVLLPLLIYIISQVINILDTKLSNTLIILIILPLIILSSMQMIRKTRPLQANKEAANYIDNLKGEKFYQPTSNLSFQFWQDRLYNFYPKTGIQPKNINKAVNGDIYISMHTNDRKKEKFIKNCFITLKEFDRRSIVFRKTLCK